MIAASTATMTETGRRCARRKAAHHGSRCGIARQSRGFPASSSTRASSSPRGTGRPLLVSASTLRKAGSLYLRASPGGGGVHRWDRADVGQASAERRAPNRSSDRHARATFEPVLMKGGSSRSPRRCRWRPQNSGAELSDGRRRRCALTAFLSSGRMFD